MSNQHKDNSFNKVIPKNGLYLTLSDFPEFSNEFAEIYPYDISDRSSLVKNITFVVTERCNLACTYCYESHNHHKHGEIMNKETAKQAIDFIFDKEKINKYYDIKASKAIVLDFIGGEPLLEIDLIDFMVDYLKMKAFKLNHLWGLNYMINFTTNGILYNLDKVQKFLKKNKGKVSVSITIDGNKELHDSCRIFPDGTGSYDTVEKSVKRWVECTERPQTKLTLAPANIKYLYEAIKHLWGLGVNSVMANVVFEKGWKVTDAKVFYKELKKLANYVLDNEKYKTNFVSLFAESIGDKLKDTRNWCGANGNMLAIGPNGRCYPCLRFMQHSLNNVKEQSIGDIYNGLENKKENDWLKNLCKIDMVSQSPDKCKNCEIASGCAICLAYNYDAHGDSNIRATYICEMHQARVLANCYYWNKLYQKLSLNKKFNLNIPKKWALNIINETEYKMLLNLSNDLSNNEKEVNI